jgi:UDP-N-acetylglucosamine--N-acetylmuramyl-(pentapeptide) pyrophosphoryl-undecaprenol N-acetylglucosamine transferase
VVYIGQRGDKLMDIPQNDPNIDICFAIFAGKFRRYHGEGWRQLLDFKTQYLNAIDGVKAIIGVVQSWRLLSSIKPEVVFTRGGFVSVPVAMAAKFKHVPYITHDSDVAPSLANRLIAPWAAMHAVALRPQNYPYPLNKTVRVGVPIDHNFHKLSVSDQRAYREQLGLAKYKWVICVTGGGNGARQLNKIIVNNATYLLKKYSDLVIVHIAGRSLAKELSEDYDDFLNKSDRKRVVVKGFVKDLYHYSGAADIVVARGGATNLAEFAAQGKACIIIPSKQLIWNVKNARALASEQAIIELSEEQAEQERRLANAVSTLLDNPVKREALANKIIQFARPNATKQIVKLILFVAQGEEG